MVTTFRQSPDALMLALEPRMVFDGAALATAVEAAPAPAADSAPAPSVAPPPASYEIQGAGYAVGMRPGVVSVSLGNSQTPDNQVEMLWVGGNSAASPVQDAATGTVIYDDVYKGVDLAVYVNGSGQVEYDLIVEQGADPELIAMDIRGENSLRIDADGNLRIGVGDSEITQQRPISYQLVDGARHYVSSSFAINPDGTIGFDVGHYDTSRDLYIDPVFEVATGTGIFSSSVAVEPLTDGKFAIAWAGTGGSYLQFYDSAGEADGTAIDLSGLRDIGLDSFEDGAGQCKLVIYSKSGNDISATIYDADSKSVDIASTPLVQGASAISAYATTSSGSTLYLTWSDASKTYYSEFNRDLTSAGITALEVAGQSNTQLDISRGIDRTFVIYATSNGRVLNMAPIVGGAVGTAVQVNEHMPDAWFDKVSAAEIADGNSLAGTVVSWIGYDQAHTSDRRYVAFRVFDVNGNAVSSEQRLASGMTDANGVSVDGFDRGGFVVAGNYYGSTITYRSYDNRGNALSAQTEVSSSDVGASSGAGPIDIGYSVDSNKMNIVWFKNSGGYGDFKLVRLVETPQTESRATTTTPRPADPGAPMVPLRPPAQPDMPGGGPADFMDSNRNPGWEHSRDGRVTQGAERPDLVVTPRDPGERNNGRGTDGTIVRDAVQRTIDARPGAANGHARGLERALDAADRPGEARAPLVLTELISASGRSGDIAQAALQTMSTGEVVALFGNSRDPVAREMGGLLQRIAEGKAAARDIGRLFDTRRVDPSLARIFQAAVERVAVQSRAPGTGRPAAPPSPSVR